MFGKLNSGRILNPYQKHDVVTITLKADLSIGSVELTIDKMLNGLVLSSVLIKAASGVIDKLAEVEALTVGRKVEVSCASESERSDGDGEKKNNNNS